MTYNKLGRAIRQLRMHRGYKQTRFSDMIGMDNANFNRIERGSQHPSIRTLSLIADRLDVKLWRLIQLAETGKTCIAKESK
jgi:transcriptional regulator with XRE-family HTH domain